MKKILIFVARVIVFTLVYLIVTDIGNLLPAIVKAITEVDTALMWVVNMAAGVATAIYVRIRRIGGRMNIAFVILSFLFGVILAELIWHFDVVRPKLMARMGKDMLIGLTIATVAFLSMNWPSRRK